MTHGKKPRPAPRNKRSSTSQKWLLFAAASLFILLLFLRMATYVSQMRHHSAQIPSNSSNIPRNSTTNKTAVNWSDSFNDGTPDFLRLQDPSDQAAFRQWFTLLADFEAGKPTKELPPEISDCAGLLRFCYREALKKHNDSWFLATGVDLTTMPGEINEWHYPESPLGAGLFRVTPGSFSPDTMATDFAQFADAKTLVERNTFLIGRDLRQAQPGDLLFFRQFEQSSPWHSMIVVRFDSNGDLTESGGQAGVIYHTGPIGHGADQKPGEIRKVAIDELLNHPKAEWRPVANNPNFLGIYRWNILRTEE
jgi:hypothetical protein